MTFSPAAERFRAARDQLVALREDYPAALAQFSWPQIDRRVQLGDRLVRRDRPRQRAHCALVIVEEDGRRVTRTFDEMARRSDQAGRLARARAGRRAGATRVMLMLGNQVELWESMLAVMKIGAVILPTTLAIGGDDLADRIERGSCTHVIASRRPRRQVRALYPAVLAASASGDGPEGWADYGEAFRHARRADAAPRHARERPAARSTSPPARPAARSWSSTPTSPTPSVI